MTLLRLVTLSISSLRNLDIEANKFYDRTHRLYEAALLTDVTLNMLFAIYRLQNQSYKTFYQNSICQQGD